MSLIPSSYRIIKNHRVNTDKSDVSIIETKVNLKKYLEAIDDNQPEREENKVEVNFESIIRAEIEERITKELELKKKAILNRTQEEAKAVLEQVRQEGYETGFTQGYKEGMDKATAEGQKIKANAFNIIKQAREEVDKYYQSKRKEIIELAATMARAIIHREIDTSDEKVLSIIEPIMQSFDEEQHIIITCHPSIRAHLKENVDKLEDLCPGCKITILEDANLEEYGCVLEDSSKIIDLQIGKQIEKILEDINKLEA